MKPQITLSQKNLTQWLTIWAQWWSQQSLIKKILPLLLYVAYIAIVGWFGNLSLDHFLTAGAAFLLWMAGPLTRPLFNFLLPLLLVAIIYDSMRYYSDYIRGPIHVTEPYDFDKFFFGINTPEGRLTPNEWLQLHTSPILDFITGFFYLFFITIYILVCLYFCFWLPYRGTKKRTPEWIRAQAYRPMWAFFWVNMIGYSTYYWYAAAPPWYVADHGLGPADLTVQASAAGAIRFDELLGTKFFTAWYSRSADVFGAIPSLHVSYPIQAVYYAFQYGALQKFTIFFFSIMCFAAVYLNHHYIIDLIWGAAYGIGVSWVMDWMARRKKKGLKIS